MNSRHSRVRSIVFAGALAAAGPALAQSADSAPGPVSRPQQTTIPSSEEISSSIDRAIEAVRTMPSATEISSSIDRAMEAVRTMPSRMEISSLTDLRGDAIGYAFSQDRAERQAEADQRERERAKRV